MPSADRAALARLAPHGRRAKQLTLTDDVTPGQVSRMAAAMRRLLLTDARPLLIDGPLTPVRA